MKDNLLVTSLLSESPRRNPHPVVSHDLCLVARIVKDFRFLDVAILNPSEEA